MIAILPPTERTDMTTTGFAVLLLALLLTACGGDAETGAGSEGDPASPAAEAEGPGPECVETDELTASNNTWDPGCIVTSGSLTVINDDQVPHTFTITGAVDEPLEEGATIEVDVSEAAEPEGETFFVCTIHPGMDGFLWVQ
jgi:plastocyanin